MTTSTLQQHLYSELKRVLWERDGGLCGLCQQPVEIERMQIDHILPRARNGSHDMNNLQPAHGFCNASKRDGRKPKDRRPRLPRLSVPVSPGMTVSEVAAELRVDPETIRRWLRDGKLRGANLRGAGGWRIRKDEVERFMRDREQGR